MPNFVIIHPNYVQLRMPIPSVWLQVYYEGGPPHMRNDYGGVLQSFNKVIPYP